MTRDRCHGCRRVPRVLAPVATDPGTDGHPTGAVRPSLRAAPVVEAAFMTSRTPSSDPETRLTGAGRAGTRRCADASARQP